MAGNGGGGGDGGDGGGRWRSRGGGPAFGRKGKCLVEWLFFFLFSPPAGDRDF